MAGGLQPTLQHEAHVVRLRPDAAVPLWKSGLELVVRQTGRDEEHHRSQWSRTGSPWMQPSELADLCIEMLGLGAITQANGTAVFPPA